MASVKGMYHCIDALVAMIIQGCSNPHGKKCAGWWGSWNHENSLISILLLLILRHKTADLFIDSEQNKSMGQLWNQVDHWLFFWELNYAVQRCLKV